MAESESVSHGEATRTDSSSGVVKTAVPASRPAGDAGGSQRELPADYLVREFADAEALLSYASEIGVDVEADTRDAILRARAAQGSTMTTELAAGLLSALANVAQQVRPVTAQSLRACADPRQARIVVRAYTWVAVALCVLLLPFSVATFVSSAISDRSARTPKRRTRSR